MPGAVARDPWQAAGRGFGVSAADLRSLQEPVNQDMIRAGVHRTPRLTAAAGGGPHDELPPSNTCST
jgi:hypothetical protein